MALGKKVRPPRPAGRKSLPRAANKRSSTGLRRKRTTFDEKWEEFVDNLKGDIQRSVNLPKGKAQAPNDKPSSVLKRAVYEFVLRHRGHDGDIHIENSIENYRWDMEKRKKLSDQKVLRRLQISYKENPFHWVLLGLQKGILVGEFEIGKDDVSRFSQQLLYADRHSIPAELLIGFLYQSGTLTEVCRKAKDPNRRENWYVALH